MKIFSRIVCVIMGHVIDWDEYDLRMEKEGHYGAVDMVLCRMCNKYIKADTVAMNEIKLFDEVWVLQYNAPIKLMVQRLEKGYMDKGVGHKVVSGALRFDLADCYRSEIECIVAQINYWKDKRLDLILGCEHEWASSTAQGSQVEMVQCNKCKQVEVKECSSAHYFCSTHEN